MQQNNINKIENIIAKSVVRGINNLSLCIHNNGFFSHFYQTMLNLVDICV